VAVIYIHEQFSSEAKFGPGILLRFNVPNEMTFVFGSASSRSHRQPRESRAALCPLSLIFTNQSSIWRRLPGQGTLRLPAYGTVD
jgi:hypothetical protein